MPTTFPEQVWTIDPFAPPAAGTILTVSQVTLTDNDDDNDIEGNTGDQLNGEDIVQSWPGDTITVILPGGATQTITGITFETAGGTAYFTPTDGTILEDSELVSTTFVDTEGPVDRTDLVPICFTLGTRMTAADGTQVLIDDLKAGDKLLTTTDGIEAARTIRWIGQRKLDRAELESNYKLLPVRITTGALGPNLPHQDLVVSRQHRMLVRSKVAQRMFGEEEVLVSAVRLCPLPGIYVDEQVESVTYVHLLFDDHEIVTAEGCATESLYTGPAALQALSPEAREEVRAIFPELKSRDYRPAPARIIPKGSRQKQLINRHAANNIPLQLD
ncbi:Hint domain-containing protein [Paracoccus sp. Z330]|uniref:Hint domain-containing protein n=1 Tax=Paracoccus onchidii TaxID=3017813 RepID=A0ABT4ZCJ7_9RHOB|nr:Hint domain-containing protein [Paracoccus onchidii]MDB6177004.1 Hint domain-containing protein [Paracoccus onchidii]